MPHCELINLKPEMFYHFFGIHNLNVHRLFVGIQFNIRVDLLAIKETKWSGHLCARDHTSDDQYSLD
jgi:hypothetical protein